MNQRVNDWFSLTMPKCNLTKPNRDCRFRLQNGRRKVLPIFKKFTAAALAGAVALTVAAPASANDRYYRHRGGGDDAAIAIGAGVIGLALGAALASGSRNNRYDYDDNYYYPRQRYYQSYPQQYYYSYPQQYYQQDYYYSYPRGYNNSRRWNKHYYRNRQDGWRQYERRSQRYDYDDDD